MKSYLFLYSILCALAVQIIWPSTAAAQLSSPSDSLKSIISTVPDDTSKVNFILEQSNTQLDENAEYGFSLAKKALSLSHSLHFSRGKAFSNYYIGIYYWYNAHYDSAEHYFRKVIKSANEMSSHYLAGQALNRLGLVHYYQAMHDSARANHKKALDDFRQVGDSAEVAQVYYHMGLTWYMQNEYEEAVSFFLKSLNLYEEYGTTRNQATLIKYLNKVYHQLGAVELIKKNKEELLTILHNETNPDHKAVVYDQIGKTYFHLQKYDSALAYLFKALNEYKTLGCINCLDVTYEHIGKIYFEQEAYEKALTFIKRSYKIRQNQGTRIYRIAIEEELAKVYAKMEKWDLAIEHYNTALAMNTEMGNNISIARNNSNLAEIWYQVKDLDMAISHAKRGLEAAEIIASQTIKTNSLKILSNAYAQQGKYDVAFKYLTEYILNKESVMQEETARRVAGIQLQYNSEKKEREIAELKSQQTIQEADLQRRNMQVSIYLILLICFFVISFLLYYGYKVHASNNRLLQLKNDKIAIKNRQLAKKNQTNELLLAEVRHRIKNNLQTISSLMSMQARRLSQHEKALLQKNQNRIKTMGLVHQKLNENYENSAIELSEYLQELVQNLINSYDFHHITYKHEVPVSFVPADLAVHLGLIINELVCNSLKYAFESENYEPEIGLLLEKKAPKQCTIKVWDNGPGFTKRNEKKCLGLKLVHMLVDEIDGKIEFDFRKGTLAVINFSMKPHRIKTDFKTKQN